MVYFLLWGVGLSYELVNFIKFWSIGWENSTSTQLTCIDMYWFVWDNMDCHRFTIYPDCKPFGWGATNWVDMSMKGRCDMLLAMFSLEALLFFRWLYTFLFNGLSDALLCSNSKLSSLGPSGHQPCIDSPYRRCFQLANDLQWGRRSPCRLPEGTPTGIPTIWCHPVVFRSFITFYNQITPHLTFNHIQKNPS